MFVRPAAELSPSSQGDNQGSPRAFDVLCTQALMAGELQYRAMDGGFHINYEHYTIKSHEAGSAGSGGNIFVWRSLKDL